MKLHLCKEKYNKILPKDYEIYEPQFLNERDGYDKETGRMVWIGQDNIKYGIKIDNCPFCGIGLRKKMDTEIELKLWTVKGEIENNIGNLILGFRCSRTALNKLLNTFYGPDFSEGSELPIRKWKVTIKPSDMELISGQINFGGEDWINR